MSRPSPKFRLNSPSPSTPATPRGASPALSPLASPATPSRSSPPETTFQRTFRGILKNVTAIHSNWLVLCDRFDDTALRICKLSTPASAAGHEAGQRKGTSRRNTNKQDQTLEKEQIALLGIFDKLEQQLGHVKRNTSTAEELLQGMSQRKGFEAAFADPLFLTWPLARLVDNLVSFSRSYTLQIIFLRKTLSHLISMSDVIFDSTAIVATPSRSSDASSRQEFLEICLVEAGDSLPDR